MKVLISAPGEEVAEAAARPRPVHRPEHLPVAGVGGARGVQREDGPEPGGCRRRQVRELRNTRRYYLLTVSTAHH